MSGEGTIEAEAEKQLEAMLEAELDAGNLENSSIMTNTSAEKKEEEKKRLEAARLAEEKKKKQKKSGDDDESEEEDEIAPVDTKKTALEKAKSSVVWAANAFSRNFVDYGPPYEKNGLEINLIYECTQPSCKIFQVHRLLNSHVDPNIPDKEDLYNTALHWCARNAHYLAMRMCRRAGANVNVVNEMGQSPLGLCILMQHPPDKRKVQIKMAKYLLREGADINWRDKGGFCPLDYAAMNQDFDLISLLLENGADVLRENHTLVAKRHHIMKYVYDPDCFRIINEKLKIEEDIYQKKEEKRLQIEKMKAEAARVKRLHTALAKRRQMKQDLAAKLEVEQKMKEAAASRKAREDAEKAVEEERKKVMRYERGKWIKNNDGTWKFRDFEIGLDNGPTDESLFQDCKSLMGKLKNKNKADKFKEKWQKLTDGGEIEFRWTKEDPFKSEEDLMLEAQAKNNAARALLSDNASIDTNDITHRDENDDVLGEGDDLLDDLLSMPSTSLASTLTKTTTGLHSTAHSSSYKR